MNQDAFRQLLGSQQSHAVAKRQSIVPAKRSRNAGTSDKTSFAPRAARPPVASKINSKKQTTSDYTDRSHLRTDASLVTTESAQLQELNDRLARKEISRQDYLREIQGLGGDVESAGRVKGLDFKLLERVKAGEDVFHEANAEDDLNAENALEAALVEKEPQRKNELEGTRQSRSQILADFRASKLKVDPKVDPKDDKQSVARPVDPQGKKFKKNKDGTITESFEEDGRKFKIIRDQDGKVLRKMVKKVVVPSTIESVKPSNDESETLPALQAYSDDDIFEGAGEYELDLDDDHDATDLKSDKKYFTSEAAEDYIPTTAEDFLEQNKAALLKAASIADRQAKADQDRFHRKQNAGFGLILDGTGAYESDLREGPEDEEEDDDKPKMPK